jgi:cytochrome c biogenesis protein CcmG/thiol:disulfide interchange protein DsbE
VTTKAPRKFPLMPFLFGLGAVALIVAVLLTMSGGSEFGEPVVTGSPLPPATEGEDTAIGAPIPEVEGKDFSGDSVEIKSDGRPKMLVFLAHWCPHCQAEVPVIQAWVDAGGLPAEIDLIGITTSTSSSRDNYPPSDWLETEGWSSPVILDDADRTVAGYYGLDAFPFWVFVGADGSVAGRTSGELPITTLVQVAEALMATLDA